MVSLNYSHQYVVKSNNSFFETDHFHLKMQFFVLFFENSVNS